MGKENGQFTGPSELRLDEDLCYVGDAFGIQIFTKDGQFLYRIGKTVRGKGDCVFSGIYGILVIKDRLYVSDHNNYRLVVLQ